MAFRHSALSLFLLAIVYTSPVSAGFLGVAGEYNIFTFGDFTQQNTDAEGRVAVGGKFDPGGTIGSGVLNGSGGFTVASSNPPSPPATPNLIVGGDFRNTGTTTKGNVFVSGNATFRTPTVLGNVTTGGNLTVDNAGGSVNGNIAYAGSLINNAGYQFWSGSATQLAAAPTPPFSFAAEASNLTQLSSTLGGLAGTGSVVFTGNSGNNTPGSLTLTGTNSTQDVFYVNGADLALANSLVINAVAGETIVINVDGMTNSMAGFGITLNNIDNHHVLYNFTTATSLTFNNIGIRGTVLAPHADVNFAGGNIDGTMIGKTLRGVGESHNYLFTGNINIPTAVPEPSSLALGVIGCLGLLGMARRRRQIALKV